MPRLETDFRTRVLKDIEQNYPGIIILEMSRQGLPDRQFLFNDRWAFLEFKRSAKAPARPNQPYYIELLNRMSFAAFIYPENEEEVLYEFERALRS